MKFIEHGLELDKQKEEQKILSQEVGQSAEIIGDPDLEDFFDRFCLAAPGVSWGRDAWEENQLGEKTRFSLSEEGNLVIPTTELGLLYRGIKRRIDDPSYRLEEYKSAKVEFLKMAAQTLEVKLTEVPES